MLCSKVSTIGEYIKELVRSFERFMPFELTFTAQIHFIVSATVVANERQTHRR